MTNKARNANKAATAVVTLAKAAASALPQTPASATPAPATPAPAIVQARANVAAKAASGIGVTLHTTGAPIKGLAPTTPQAKPTAKMLQAIATIAKHPGKGLGIKRFHLYKVGCTLLEAKTTPGMTPLDITFYVENGLMTLRPCTEAELKTAVAAWEAKQPKAAAPAPQAKVA